MLCIHLDLDWIRTTFKLCSPLTPTSVDSFKSWIMDTFFNLAMGTETQQCLNTCNQMFLSSLPQWTILTQQISWLPSLPGLSM